MLHLHNSWLFCRLKNENMNTAWSNPFEIPDTEFAPFYRPYIDNVRGCSIQDALEKDAKALNEILRSVDAELADFAYAPGKWTVKEVLIHCMDAERIFTYRALRFLRGDQTELSGFDQDSYVPESMAYSRTIGNIKKEWLAVRAATSILFKHSNEQALLRQGKANGFNVSVRALGLIIAGHNLHHVSVLKEKYQCV